MIKVDNIILSVLKDFLWLLIFKYSTKYCLYEGSNWKWIVNVGTGYFYGKVDAEKG